MTQVTATITKNELRWQQYPGPRYITIIYTVTSNNRSDSDLQFALPKARSNSGAKMIKHSTLEIWSRIPLDIKNKTSLALFLEEYKK